MKDSRGDTYSAGATRDSAGDTIKSGQTKDSAGDTWPGSKVVYAGRKRHKKHRRRRHARPNAKAPLGQGGRFAALKQELSGEKGVTNPGGLAAAIGRKKLGKARFQKLAQKAR